MGLFDFKIDFGSLWVRAYRWSRSALKAQGKGLLIGFSVAAIAAIWVYFCYFHQKIIDYYNYGEFVTDCTVGIGENIVISPQELTITFSSDIYRIESADEIERDTTIVFPQFKFWYPGIPDYFAKPNSNFHEGRCFSLSGRYFYYTVRLTNIQVHSTDTSATFRVFRKIVPEAKPPDY